MLNIFFFIIFPKGKAEETIPSFAERSGASLIVSDFSPLRIGRIWRDTISESLPEGTGMHEVDSHSTVPVWIASEKLEYGARTIRGKINK